MLIVVRLGFICAVSYFLGVGWQHFPVCGLQGVLISSLQSLKFNFLVAGLAGLYFLSKDLATAESRAVQVFSLFGLAPIAWSSLFTLRPPLPNTSMLTATAVFEEGVNSWHATYASLLGPGLLHGWVFVIAFVLSVFLLLPDLCTANTVTDSNYSSGYPATKLTRVYCVTVLALFGFTTGAYWAFFSLTWGNWFNYDPVELAYLLMLLGLLGILHHQPTAYIFSYSFLALVAAFVAFLCGLRFGVLDSKHAVNFQAVSPLWDKISGHVGWSYLVAGSVGLFAMHGLWQAYRVNAPQIAHAPHTLKHPQGHHLSMQGVLWIAIISTCTALFGVYLVCNQQPPIVKFAWFVVWVSVALFFFLSSANIPTRQPITAVYKLWGAWHWVLALLLFAFAFAFTYLATPVYPQWLAAEVRICTPTGYSFLMDTELEGPHTAKTNASAEPAVKNTSGVSKPLPPQLSKRVVFCFEPYSARQSDQNQRSTAVPNPVTPTTALAQDFFYESIQSNLNQLHPLNSHPLLIKTLTNEAFTQYNILEVDAVFSYTWGLLGILVTTSVVFL